MFVQCASGSSHSLYVDHHGFAWSCGSNSIGELGLGSYSKLSEPVVTPAKIHGLSNIISVSGGRCFSLFLDQNGCVWSCGWNQFGQLGLGDKINRNIAQQIEGLPVIISICALGYSSIFLDVDGNVWRCGQNKLGELGLGDPNDTSDRYTPVKINYLPKIQSIAGGWHHSLYLDYGGSVWGCGNNGAGQLSLGDESRRYKAGKIIDLPKIKAIAGGVHFSLFLDIEENVWVCGGNDNGALGLGHTTHINKAEKNTHLKDIVAVAGGNGGHSIFLDELGNIFTCGSNSHGHCSRSY